MDNAILEKLKKIRHFVLDMDGTIYLGNRLFPQTLPFLEAVRQSGRDFTFFTNNSAKNTRTYMEKLRTMGIAIPQSHMLVSNAVMIAWLHNNRPGETAYVVGTPELLEAITNAGIPIDDETADYVLLGFDTTLTFDKLVKACNLVRAGKAIYGLNPDLNCPTETGFIPDCGSIAALIKASTGVQCSFFGKPSPHTYRYILEQVGCKEDELAIIGDRLYTDIATVQGTASLGILVLSGETKREDILPSPVQPDLVFDHIGELIPYLYKEEQTHG